MNKIDVNTLSLITRAWQCIESRKADWDELADCDKAYMVQTELELRKFIESAKAKAPASGQAEAAAALEDIQAIRNVAGDIDIGYAGKRSRGNIGGIVSRACDQLEAAWNARTRPQIPAPSLPTAPAPEVLSAGMKYTIADEINIEGRSKSDIVQDVYDALKKRGALPTEAPAPEILPMVDEDVDDDLTPKLLSCPLDALVDWYNSPNAVTANRFQYFYELVRHVKHLQQAALPTPPDAGSARLFMAAEELRKELEYDPSNWNLVKEPFLQALLQHRKDSGNE